MANLTIRLVTFSPGGGCLFHFLIPTYQKAVADRSTLEDGVALGNRVDDTSPLVFPCYTVFWCYMLM